MNERLKNFLWLIAVIVAFTIFSSVRGVSSVYLDFGDDSLTLTAPENYSRSIRYSDIDEIELIDQFESGSIISGGENRRHQWGTWENDTWGEYILCVSKKIDNALLIKYSGNQLLVLNYESEDTTASLLSLMQEIIADRTN